MKSNLISKSETAKIFEALNTQWKIEVPKQKNVRTHQIDEKGVIITGNLSVDHSIQISLNYAAAKIMDQVLEKKGNALFKIFDGEYSNEFYQYVKKKFTKVKLKKPKVSRKQSSELYCICLGYLS